MEFEFISDLKFKNLIKRDFQEMEVCLKNKCNKSVLILSGSIIEAILVDQFFNNLPDGYSREDVLKMDLFGLINLGHKQKIISQRSKDLSSVVRSFRNLIHPGKEFRENEKFDEETATISSSLVKIIVHDIKSNFELKFGYTSTDIINKLEKDNLSFSIFENLIDRLNYSERANLLNDLTDYNLLEREYHTKLEETKPYIQVLKPLLGAETIKIQLNKLVSKIINGSEWEVIEIYYLYNDDLGLLNEADLDLVLTYMIGMLKTIDTLNVQNLSRNKAYSTIGKYLNNEKLQTLFKRAFKNFISIHDYTNYYFSIQLIDQILNSLTTDFRKEIDNIIESMPNYFKDDYLKAREKSEDDLPF